MTGSDGDDAFLDPNPVAVEFKHPLWNPRRRRAILDLAYARGGRRGWRTSRRS